MTKKIETKNGKYATTPHKTIGEIVKLAEDRVRAGESPVEVVADLIEGYELGYQSANAELIEDAARLAEGTTLAAAEPVRREVGDTFEIGYDKWRACGNGDKWNVRDAAGALLLETQDGYADYKLPAKDAEKIARLAASAPALLAALEPFAQLNPLAVPQYAGSIEIARAAIALARGESLAAKFEAGWQKSIAAGSVRGGQS